MMQSHRKLSKQSGQPFLSSPQNLPFVITGGVLFSVALLVYFNFRFAYSIFSPTLYNDIGYQSLQSYPVTLPTKTSTAQEWEQQSAIPMIGAYRYSSIATIQLPTTDLEELKMGQKQTEGNGFFQNPDLPNNNDVVVLTRKGHKFNPEDRKRTPNQDRVLVLSRRDDSVNGENESKRDWWIGLFDGHGYYGQIVSQYVSSEFARRINKEWEEKNFTNKKNSTIVKDLLKDIFVEINHSMPKFMAKAGSTGISVLKRGDELYISNIGDSVAFVASYNKSESKMKIIYSTKPHKPDTPSERKRIEETGGRVMEAPFKGASARLVIPTTVRGEVMETGLAMSRSFGDHDGLKFGLSDEPDTDVIALSQLDKNQEYIVVVATDGLIDFGKLSEEEVALAMAKAFSTEDIPSMKQRTFVARELILASSHIWDSEPWDYRDDISIVAHNLRL